MVVGMMIASEVPTQSCMRTSSGTPRTRNTSYSTGTMMAPPPMPNRPARMPVDDAARHDRRREPARSRRAERPACMDCPGNVVRPRRCAPIRRALSITSASASRRTAAPAPGLTACGREMPAEGARARHAVEQAEHMARDGMQPRAARKLALDVGDERLRRVLRRGERRGLAEEQRIDGEQPPRLLIGGAAHHHAVDVREMLPRACSTLAMPPLSTIGKIRMRGLEPIDTMS